MGVLWSFWGWWLEFEHLLQLYWFKPESWEMWSALFLLHQRSSGMSLYHKITLWLLVFLCPLLEFKIIFNMLKLQDLRGSFEGLSCHRQLVIYVLQKKQWRYQRRWLASNRTLRTLCLVVSGPDCKSESESGWVGLWTEAFFGRKILLTAAYCAQQWQHFSSEKQTQEGFYLTIQGHAVPPRSFSIGEKKGNTWI